jgi:hypothetical protein
MNPIPLLLGGVIAAIAAVASKKSSASSGNYELDPSMPAALQSQVLGALANEKDPNRLMALSQQMAAQGYPLAATALATGAAQLNVAPQPAQPGRQMPPPGVIPQPSPTVPTLDMSIDPQTAAAVLQALATETDPQKLAQFSASLQGKFPIAAALLQAKATALGFIPGVQPSAPPAPAPSVYVPPYVPPPPAPPPAPRPAPSPAVVPPAPPGTLITFTAGELAPRASLHQMMTADEWEQTLILLNDWLNANAADPKINFVDLSWFRDQADDLSDSGNFDLALEAMYSLQYQNGAYFGDPSLGEVGIPDAQTLGTLFAWAQKNPGSNTANMSVLGPFMNGLLAALRKQGGTNVAGVRTGWKSSGRYLPAKMAMRRIG